MEFIIAFLLTFIISLTSWSIASMISPNWFNLGQNIKIVIITFVISIILYLFKFDNIGVKIFLTLSVYPILIMKLWDIDEIMDALKICILAWVVNVLITILLAWFLK